MRASLRAALLGALLLPLCAAPPKKPAKGPKPGKAAPALPPELPPAGASGELLDPASGRSRAIGAMAETRSDFQATPLADGRVLVSGGSLRGPSTECFDPATRRFSPGPPMTVIRQGHRALRLKDGRLLLLGGTETPTPAEVLEPGASKFTALGKEPLFGLSAEALELEEGILLIDGMSGKAWLWDGAKKFKSAGSLASPRLLFRATRLADGRVLVSGGWPAPAEAKPNRTGYRRNAPPKEVEPRLPLEAFNPKKVKWSAWKGLPAARARHQALPLADGRVLLLGGFGASADNSCRTLELVDPARETCSAQGEVPAGLGTNPAFLSSEGGTLMLAEGSPELRKGADALALLNAGSPAGRLANAFQEPQLVPLAEGRLLVLGAPQWGPSLERWDPRTKQCTYVGALRAGTETLALMDGKLLALGAAVDQLDPKTGALTPLGWRPDLDLRKAKPYLGPGHPKLPAFPDGEVREEAALLDLGGGRSLIVGGRSGNFPDGSELLWLWEPKRKKLEPAGSLKTRRRFPDPMQPGSGVLKLPDGSVLIWGAAQP